MSAKRFLVFSVCCLCALVYCPEVHAEESLLPPLDDNEDVVTHARACGPPLQRVQDRLSRVQQGPSRAEQEPKCAKKLDDYMAAHAAASVQCGLLQRSPASTMGRGEASYRLSLMRANWRTLREAQLTYYTECVAIPAPIVIQLSQEYHGAPATSVGQVTVVRSAKVESQGETTKIVSGACLGMGIVLMLNSAAVAAAYASPPPGTHRQKELAWAAVGLLVAGSASVIVGSIMFSLPKTGRRAVPIAIMPSIGLRFVGIQLDF